MIEISQHILATAGIAYAACRLGSLDGMRVFAEQLGPLGKLVHCPFCTGFWAAIAVSTAGDFPREMLTFGASGALLGAIFAMLTCMAGNRGIWPGTLLGSLLGVFLGGVGLPLWSGVEAAELAVLGFSGALVSLAVAFGIDALMAYVAKATPDDWP